jgi:Pyruvate phosphate dikinase, AMP/ATP-binding domain
MPPTGIMHVADMGSSVPAAEERWYSTTCKRAHNLSKLISLATACTSTLPHLVQGVWASQYNERAMLSMRKVGIDFRDIRMAVLCQRVVPAAYAYVIHTTNPSSGAAKATQTTSHRRHRTTKHACHHKRTAICYVQLL